MIELGRKVQDRITGFTGTVMGFVVYISGCNQALVLPAADTDNKYPDSVWFDEQRLVYLDDSKLTLDNGKTPGFDKVAPTK